MGAMSASYVIVLFKKGTDAHRYRFLALVLVTVLAVPGIIKQLGQLANQVPDYIEQVPGWWDGVQAEIVRRFDVDPETLAKAVPMERFTQEATSALPDILGNAPLYCRWQTV